MLASLYSAYPSEEDIKYGLWLKRFATLLPTYADQYGLCELQLLEIQSIAAEYLDFLIYGLQRANDHIAGLSVGSPVVASELLSCHEYTQIVQHLVAKFITHVQQHPSHTTCNGQSLCLHAIPLLY